MAIDSAVSIKSFFSIGGLLNKIPRFILEASKDQFEIPTNDTSSSYWLGSSSECKTFKGLWGLNSHKPISSITTVGIYYFGYFL